MVNDGLLLATGLDTFKRAVAHAPRRAIVDEGRQLSYRELLVRTERARRSLLAHCELPALDGRRIALLVRPGADHVVAQWAVWAAGGVVLPLAHSHPPAELQYALADADASLLLYSEDRAEAAASAAEKTGCDRLPVRVLGEEEAAASEPRSVAPQADALILYTSGTTGRAKGVVHTHASLDAQRRMLETAWQWRSSDRTLALLPLHHLHGLINVVAGALWAGATCEFAGDFDARATWERLASGDITVLMAVPTIYSKLLAAHADAEESDQRRWGTGAARLRLMVSGSAALPVRVLDAWYAVTRHRLLERYGMTETGMILGQPLFGERLPGTVGTPLPGVQVRFRQGAGHEPVSGSEQTGELEVSGPALFRAYWQRPEETAATLQNGWFRTGDVAELRGGNYRLLGRSSTDILKTGGYKVSALEIEEVLRDHDAVAECAVVGLPDEEWGQRVAAAVVLRPGTTLDLEELRSWTKERLAPYKAPTLLYLLAELPRNALGKVQKPRLAELLASGPRRGAR